MSSEVNMRIRWRRVTFILAVLLMPVIVNRINKTMFDDELSIYPVIKACEYYSIVLPWLILFGVFVGIFLVIKALR